MNTAEPRMSNLFLQLGLDAEDQSIADFIRSHQLRAEVNIVDAPFWSEAQRQFIAEQMKADAGWTIVVDQLNEALHEDAVKQQTGLN